jgi:hypothetical protein
MSAYQRTAEVNFDPDSKKHIRGGATHIGRDTIDECHRGTSTQAKNIPTEAGASA